MKLKIVIIIILNLLLSSCCTFSKPNKQIISGKDPTRFFSWLIYKESNGVNSIIYNNEYLVILEKLKDDLNKGDYYYFKYLVLVNSRNTENKKDMLKELLIKADLNGNENAGFELYQWYFPLELDKKMKYLDSSAQKGYAFSQFIIGNRYINGEQGFKKDEKKGIDLIRLSAMQGLQRAVDFLAHKINKRYLSTDEYMFWNMMKYIYYNVDEDDNQFVFDIKKINNKNLFCTKVKDYVIKNEIDTNIYSNEVFDSLKILIQCASYF
jgi:TPR repeat protein